MELNSGCLKMYLASLLFRKPHWCVSANHFVSKATVETVAIKIEFVTLLGHWTQGIGKNPHGISESKLRVLTISWPGSRHPDRAALSAIINTPLRGQDTGPGASLAGSWAPPLPGKLFRSRGRYNRRTHSLRYL